MDTRELDVSAWISSQFYKPEDEWVVASLDRPTPCQFVNGAWLAWGKGDPVQFDLWRPMTPPLYDDSLLSRRARGLD